MGIYKQITANGITLTPYPFIKELAMEAYLIENNDILNFDKENFEDVEVLDAEIPLGQGRIDLLVKYSAEYLGIVELKLEEINNDSLTQLEGYLDQCTQILGKGTKYWDDDSSTPKWVGVLAGSDISSELRDTLLAGYEHNGIPIVGMTIRRFRSSNGEIFVVTDTFFQRNKNNKDLSTYKFNGKSYNKGRLVNAVIKKVVENNPNITFAELKQKFPDSIQKTKGGFGVFDSQEKGEDIFKKTGRKRYYINPDEVIKLADSVISTCTEWNITNIQEFIKTAQQLGYTIDKE